jgi:ATPase subunit of ABC transporter with duplicated ATPase domains
MAQYIYTMNGVGKVVPPQTEILKNISLNFFPGAKIGVLGYNGAGKSTLLRIMAGVDTDYVGEARPQTGIKIGYLAQEPELDDSLDVRGNVELGVAETKALLDQFNQVNMKFAEPMSDDEMNDLLAQQAELQEKIEAAGAWDLDRKLDVAADALRLPPWEAAVEHLSGGARGAVPVVAVESGHANPGRTYQPPRRRIGSLAGAFSAGLSGHRGGGYPRSLFP